MKTFILFALLLINTHSFTQTFWNKLEGLYGATSSSLTSDSSENLYFACSDLFKSTNYGLNWTKINSPSYNSRGIFCNNEVLLSYDSDNLYRSTNYGINWDICLTIEWGVTSALLLIHKVMNLSLMIVVGYINQPIMELTGLTSCLITSLQFV